jgi:molybdate transport system substrate-binding protein
MSRPRNSQIYLALLLAAVLLSTACAKLRRTAALPQGIVVSAAISLRDALKDVAQLYRTENPNVAVSFNLAGSGTLQRQIEQGAPVDVFISASPDEMNALDSKGLLLPGTRKNLLANRLVLIVPAASTGIASFQDLARPEVKAIAIGDPQTVPAGKYAQEVLAHLGLYDRLKSELVLASDVRQVLAYVSTGNADAGIVYATDAPVSRQVKIASTAPPGSHSPVIYPVAVVKSSNSPEAARQFEAFLQSPRAQTIFQNHGFLPPPR